MINYDRILDELQRRIAVQPETTVSVALYVDLLAAQARVQIDQREYAGIAQIAPVRVERGLPVLPPEAFRADCAALARLCDETCVITARHRADLRDIFGSRVAKNRVTSPAVKPRNRSMSLARNTSSTNARTQRQ